jgi:hypothetical protein
MYREPFERYFLNKLVAEYPAVLKVNDLRIRVCPSRDNDQSNWTVHEISPDLPEDLRDKVWSLVTKLQRDIEICMDEPPDPHHVG